MAVNNKMKRYGFREGKAFEGIMPKLMELVGDENCVGYSDVNVSMFDPTTNSVESMKVVSTQDIAEK